MCSEDDARNLSGSHRLTQRRSHGGKAAIEEAALNDVDGLRNANRSGLRFASNKGIYVSIAVTRSQ